MGEHRHFLEAEALRDYLACPQKYAYRYLYDLDDPPRTDAQVWTRAVRRTALSMVRETLEHGPISDDQAMLLWQLHTRHTVVAATSRLDVQGREALSRFHEWLVGAPPCVLAPVRTLNFPLTARRSIDVELTADFQVTKKRQKIRIILAPPDPGFFEAVAGCDTSSWMVYDLQRHRARRIRKRSKAEAQELHGVLEQGLRGMARQIVWPHRDARCTPCPYGDICVPGDARRSILSKATGRQRVQERVAMQRQMGVTP